MRQLLKGRSYVMVDLRQGSLQHRGRMRAERIRDVVTGANLVGLINLIPPYDDSSHTAVPLKDTDVRSFDTIMPGCLENDRQHIGRAVLCAAHAPCTLSGCMCL
jgi:hypothetical protein